MSLRTYPYTIENGHGESLTFTGVTHDPDGDRIGADGVAQPGAGPPMHVHYLQDEAARVVTGRMGYQVLGQEPRVAEAGELVVWPAGTAHKWWNAGTTELRLTGWCKPPGNIEFFLGTMFASVKRNGGAFVQRVLIPILYVVGRALGKYKKYADAPEPISPT